MNCNLLVPEEFTNSLLLSVHNISTKVCFPKTMSLPCRPNVKWEFGLSTVKYLQIEASSASARLGWVCFGLPIPCTCLVMHMRPRALTWAYHILFAAHLNHFLVPCLLDFQNIILKLQKTEAFRLTIYVKCLKRISVVTHVQGLYFSDH